MKVTKEGQYIVIERDDGKIMKYDLALRQTIGIRGSIVNGLSSQLRAYSASEIVQACVDENYKQFLEFALSKAYGNSIHKLFESMRRTSHYEAFFAAGITNFDHRMTMKLSDMPKSMLAACRKHDIRITDDLVKMWIKYPDMMRNILSQEYLSMNATQACKMASHYGTVVATSRYYGNHFLALVSSYNYNPVALMRYIDSLCTYEGIDIDSGIIQDIHDHARMMSALSNKYDKYPRNFLTTHRIASRNYERLQAMFDEEKFKTKIDTGLEWKKLGYVVIYPKSAQDIKDEAVQQSNCVASYIDGILDGYRHIVFLRKETDPTKSLVTVEIRDYKVVQARERYNQKVSPERENVLRLYGNYLAKLKEERSNVH